MRISAGSAIALLAAMMRHLGQRIIQREPASSCQNSGKHYCLESIGHGVGWVLTLPVWQQ